MIIEIAGGTYPTAGWWFIFIPVAIFVVGLVVNSFWDDGFAVATVGIFAAFTYALLFGLAMAPDLMEREEAAQKTQALEEQGFENVNVDGDSFTASRDGDYFSGSLLDLGENTYQVVEKVEVE